MAARPVLASRPRYPLCDACAERQGGREEFDREREGAGGGEGRGGGGGECFVCRGLTSRFPEVERSVVRRVKGYQFRTFSVGVIIPAGIQEREDQLRSDLQIRGRETIKAQLGRGIAEAVRRGLRGKKVDRQHPDLMVLADLERGEVSVAARSVFVYGRYTKPPGVAQKKELCEECRGRGCGLCDGGFRREVSVERVLEDRLGRALRAERAKFTWMGSEDPESIVFSPGRPFIAEVKGPRKREVPARIVARTGKGAMKVTGLRVLRGRPTAIPSFTFKTRAFIRSEGGRLEGLPAGLAGAMRRAPIQFRNSKGKTVNKRVYSLRVRKRRGAAGGGGGGLVAEIKLDGGLPVKRLISGGSVSLSLAELLKTPLSCQRFDILRVWESGSFKFGKV